MLPSLAALLLAGELMVVPTPDAEVAPPPPEPQAHYARAALETLAGLGLATVWYWSAKDLNSRDWDLYWGWGTLKSKIIGEQTAFDVNDFSTNAYSHPRSGLMLHTVGRSNGLGVGESVVLNAISTWIWEALIEFREKISLNDLLVNPGAGLSLGESVFQLGLFFRRGADNHANRTLGTALAPLLALNDRFDGARPRRDIADDMGFSREVWHRFELALGVGLPSDSQRRMEVNLGVDTQLVTIPGYERPGSATIRARAGSLSSLRGGLSISSGLSHTDILTRVLLAGIYRRNFTRDDDGRTRGTGLLLGLANAFDFQTHVRPAFRQDLLANLNLIGPLVEFTARRGDFRVRASAEGYVDFALVHAQALDALLASGAPLTGIKTSLSWYGYYFARGLSARAHVWAWFRQWDGGVLGLGDLFDSIEGLDRHQNEVIDDFNLIDRRLAVRAWLGYQPHESQIRLSASVDRLRRSGAIPAKDLSSVTNENRVLGDVSFVF